MPRLVRALLLLTADPAEAEDLAQEALSRVYERWDRVQEMDSPEGYLYRTALNLNRKRVRRLLVRGRRVVSLPQRRQEDLSPVDDRVAVLDAVAWLPRAQREALLLVELLGLDTKEAGRLLGIEPGSVRSRLMEGRQHNWEEPMAEETRDLLRRAVDWYEPRVPDPFDATRRMRARVRRAKAAVVVVAFALVAGSLGVLFAAFAQRETSVERPAAPAPSSQYVKGIQEQLTRLRGKLTEVHVELASAAELVNTLASKYGDAMRKLQTTSSPTAELHRRVARLRAQLAAQKARMNEIVAQEKLLVDEVKALLKRLTASR